MQTRIKKIADFWTIKLEIDGQGFALDYKPKNKRQAIWMRRMLNIAIGKTLRENTKPVESVFNRVTEKRDYYKSQLDRLSEPKSQTEREHKAYYKLKYETYNEILQEIT